MDKKLFFQYTVTMLAWLVGTIYVIVVMRIFVFELGRVDGRSMENTYVDDDIFLVEKMSLMFRTPRRGDVVQVVNRPTNVVLIKRIVGLPGEQVEVKQNNVYIIEKDGTELLLHEPYLKPYTVTSSKTGKPTTYGPFGDNEYFIMGDNRPLSGDSRYFGAVSRCDVIGLGSGPVRL